MQIAKIVIDKDIRHGKPVIKVTRVPIDIILGALALLDLVKLQGSKAAKK